MRIKHRHGAQAFGLRNEEREEFIFVARQIPEQIQEIAQNFPNVAPKYFRKALKKLRTNDSL
jgi:hypothetical protein